MNEPLSASATAERRRRGRPSLEDRGLVSTASTKLPKAAHDRFIELAKQRRVRPAELLRRLVFISIRSRE